MLVYIYIYCMKLHDIDNAERVKVLEPVAAAATTVSHSPGISSLHVHVLDIKAGQRPPSNSITAAVGAIDGFHKPDLSRKMLETIQEIAKKRRNDEKIRRNRWFNRWYSNGFWVLVRCSINARHLST